MILFKSNASQVAEALRQIAREYPREFPRVLATVGLGLRNRMVAAMPNSAPPLRFRAYNQFTVLLRAIQKKGFRSLYSRSGLRRVEGIRGGLKTKKNGELTKASIRKLEKRGNLANRARNRLRALSGGKFGGKLATKSVMRYAKQARDSVYVGYLNDKLTGLARKFQDSERRALTKEERAFRHRIQGPNIDRHYDRPARPIFKDFAKDPATRDYIIDVAKKRLQSIITKEANKVKA